MKKILAILLIVSSPICRAWQPIKPIEVISPVAVGAGNEMAFRAVSLILEKQGKATFVIESRAGADGNIGMNHFAIERPADGYHAAIPSCQSTFVSSEIHYQDMIKFKPMEFNLITNLGKAPLVFVANAKSPIKTVPELITAVKTGQRSLNFATGGAAHQLAFEYFMDKVGGNRSIAQNVPYKGPLPAVQDAAAGATEFAIVPATVANTLLPTGKIRIIGIAGEYPLKGLPGVPLMKDYVPGLNVYACWNLVLPKGTNPEIVKWYVDTFVTALRSPEYRRWADENMVSIDTKAHGPEGLKRDMEELRAQWQTYVRKMPSPR